MAVKTPENLRDLIELNLAERPDQTFIYWRDEEVSYRALDERANRVANGLRALGVGKGDVVSVYLPNCPEFLYTWFGITKLGAVFGPVNAMFKGDEVRHVLSDSGAVVAVTSRDAARHHQRRPRRVPRPTPGDLPRGRGAGGHGLR